MPDDGQAALLSLKNIYRLLTKDDYPAPSAAVIGRAGRRGLTIHAFWQEILGRDLAVTAMGERLWHVGETRSRYLSDLFNRTRPGVFYADYFAAASMLVNEALLLSILRRTLDALRRVGYDRAALMARLEDFLALILQHDSAVSPAVHSYLAGLMWKAPDFANEADSGAFFDAYLLSVLALHAFFGDQMGNGPMSRLRREPAAQPEALLAAQRAAEPARPAGWPERLTSQACQLSREPLPREQFLGRGQALEELTAQLEKGGKILVSGMGGIGKTELVRQALQSVMRQGLFTRVACVQYRDSLVESFQRAFPGLDAASPEARFEEALERLSRGSGRCLLLVDGADTPPYEDQALDTLAGLGCDVLITSRLAGMPGFRVFALEGLAMPDAAAVFAAAYGQQLAGAEYGQLLHLIEEHLAGHPLMCQMLGNLARSRHLAFSDLYEGLKHHGLQGSYTSQAQTVQVEQTLRQLFHINDLAADRRRLLRLFALLPQGLYGFSRLRELLADITQDRDALADHLQSLAYLGWLSASSGGYSMHPVIMEALRDSRMGMEEYPRFWALLKDHVRGDKFREWDCVALARHALERVHINREEGLSLLLHTGLLLCEQGLLDASERLMNLAYAFTRGEAQGKPDFVYEYHALRLFLLRCQGRFDGAEAHVLEIIRLLPLAEQVELRPYGLGHALFFAVNLSLREEAETLLGLMENGAWRAGLEKAEYCYMMCEYHAYTDRSSPDMIAWSRRGLAELDRAGSLQTVQAANLHHAQALGWAYAGNTEEAQAHFDEFSRLYQAWFGNTDALAFAVLDNSLGIAFYQAGDYHSALPRFTSALQRVRRAGTGDSHLAQSYLGNISNAYLHLKDYARAADYGNRAYEMHKRLNPQDNLQTSLLLNNLGCIHRDSGDYDKALDLLTRARDLAAQLAGPDSIPCAEPEFNLGRLKLLTGDRAEAAARLELAVPVFEQGYGINHPRTLMARGFLKQAREG